jgi:hypothetical protein
MNFAQVLIGRSSYTLLLLGEIEEHIGQNTASLQIAFVKQNHTPVTNENSDTLPTLYIPQSDRFTTRASGNVVAVDMPLHTLK